MSSGPMDEGRDAAEQEQVEVGKGKVDFHFRLPLVSSSII